MNQRIKFALKRERARELCLPALLSGSPLFGRAVRRRDGQAGRDRLPLVRPDSSRIDPVMSGRGLSLSPRGNPLVTLVSLRRF